MGRRPLHLIGLMGMAVSAVFLTVAMLLLVSFPNLLAPRLLVPHPEKETSYIFRPSGPVQLDVLHQHRGHLQLRGLLRGGSWSHPLVHHG